MDIVAQNPLLLPYLLSLGIGAGFLSGLLGVGGGIILVPGLLAIFRVIGFPDDLLMHMAVGTSLAIIIPTGFSSAASHLKRKAVDFSILFSLAPGAMIGALTGTLIAQHLSAMHLSLVFVATLIVLAILMMTSPERLAVFPNLPRQPWPFLSGTGIGAISSLIGIGGATLSVPYMTMCSTPIHRAVGTAAALGLFISIPGAFGFMQIGHAAPDLPAFSAGYVFLPAWLTVTIVSVLSAPAGAAAAHKMPVTVLRVVFAIFMIIVALKMAFQFLD